MLSSVNESLSLFIFPFSTPEANASKAISDSEALAEEQGMQEWKGGGGRQGTQIITRSPKSGNQKMANIGKVKFQPPSVPVIFVLGLNFSSLS